MVNSFNIGVSALQQFQKDLDIIGNNIANVNTTGFKSSRANFSDSFSNSLQSAASTATGAASQVGTGVQMQSIQDNFQQGTNTATGYESDLAIAGAGFFLVRDSATGATFATRSGEFHVDNSGYLVTNTGLRVQGYNDTTLGTVGDLKIDNTNDGTTPHGFSDPPTNSVPLAMQSYHVGGDGKISVQLNDLTGTQFVRGQVLLQNFKSPGNLVKQGNNLYSGFTAAGAVAATPGQPGATGLGQIQSGALEMSNVELTSELTDLITAQRAFQANARVITTSDDILQEVVNLKR